MDWFKKHADTIIILAGFASAVFWMSGKFSSLEKDIDTRFASLEKDMAIIKTVLIMKNVMPKELVEKGEK